MAAADTARLIASLELDNRKFVQGSAVALRAIGRIDSRLGAFSGAVNRNLGRLVDTTITRGTQLFVDSIRGGIDSLADLESATTSVDSALASTGKRGQVTAQQIATWANEIEAATDAAFDDKDITRNATTLIRYGKVTTDNLRPALEVMTDLAAKTGSVDSASTLLAKALADPTKAAGKLSRAGVILTKEQQKQVVALTKAGKLGKAQKVILDALASSTKNAARDSVGAFGDMRNELGDTVEDAQRLLAKGASPVLLKLGTKIREALADPNTMRDIENIGKSAAGLLDSAIDFGSRIPWGQIREAAGALGTGAKAALDFFTGLPPWVQTAVLTGWGLNKVSGGLVTDIAGELGKGLVKGVLGMNAAVVNINAGVVNGGTPGVPGTQPGVAPNQGPMGLLSFLGLAGTGAAVGTFAAGLSKAVTDGIADAFGQGAAGRTAGDQARGLAFGPFETIRSALAGEIPAKFDAMIAELKALVGPKPPTTGETRDSLNAFRQGERESWTQPLDNIGKKQDEARATFERSVAAVDATTRSGSRDVAATARSGTAGTTAAVNSQGAATRAAIAANRPIVNVELNVSPTSVEKNTTIVNRYGPTNGSYGGGTGGGTSKYD